MSIFGSGNGNASGQPLFGGNSSSSSQSNAPKKHSTPSIKLVKLPPKISSQVLCKGLSDASNNPQTLDDHFSIFGQVNKIECHFPLKTNAVITYDDTRDAKNAIEYGKSLENGEKIDVTYYHPVPMMKKPKSPADNLKQAARKRQTAIKIPPLTMKLPLFTGEPEPSTVADSPVLLSPSIEDDGRLHSTLADLSKKLSKYDSSFSEMFNLHCPTLMDKFQVLLKRDLAMQALFKKHQAHFVEEKTFIGICEEMCPEQECYRRQVEKMIRSFECSPSNPGVIDRTLAVKDYARSSADQSRPLAQDLRTPPALERTLAHLFGNILPLLTKNNANEWYAFMWNSTRSIRKDCVQLRLVDDLAVAIYERCARFHVYVFDALHSEDDTVFDVHLNSKNLSDCIISLKHVYHDLERKGHQQSPNFSEFVSYSVLLNLADCGQVMSELRQAPAASLNAPCVKEALAAFDAYHTNNWVGFFKCLLTAAYLPSCLLIRHIDQVRSSALEVMCSAGLGRHQPPSLASIAAELLFEDVEDCRQFIQEHGISVKSFSGVDCVMFAKSDFFHPKSVKSARLNSLMESKVVCSSSELVYGGRVPSVEATKCPANSFTQDGVYVGDIKLYRYLAGVLAVVPMPARQRSGETNASERVAGASWTNRELGAKKHTQSAQNLQHFMTNSDRQTVPKSQPPIQQQQPPLFGQSKPVSNNNPFSTATNIPNAWSTKPTAPLSLFGRSEMQPKKPDLTIFSDSVYEEIEKEIIVESCAVNQDEMLSSVDDSVADYLRDEVIDDTVRPLLTDTITNVVNDRKRELLMLERVGTEVMEDVLMSVLKGECHQIAVERQRTECRLTELSNDVFTELITGLSMV